MSANWPTGAQLVPPRGRHEIALRLKKQRADEMHLRWQVAVRALESRRGAVERGMAKPYRTGRVAAGEAECPTQIVHMVCRVAHKHPVDHGIERAVA